MSYWDSSALLKLYTQEADSNIFEQFAASTKAIPTIARVGIYEIQTVLRRKETEGALGTGAAEIVYRRLAEDGLNGNLRIIEFSIDVETKFQEVLIRCFQKSPMQVVRTLDAIHLASSLIANEGEFVATDKRLRNAALALGLKVFP